MTTTHTSRDLQPAPASEVETTLFDEGEFCAYLYDSRTNKAHRLSPSASAVWMLCDGVTPTDQIVEELTGLLGQPRETIDADVQTILHDLWSLGLLAQSPPPRDEMGTSDDDYLERPPDP